MVSQEISGSLICGCNLCHDGMHLVNTCSFSGLTSINGSFYFLPVFIFFTPFFFVSNFVRLEKVACVGSLILATKAGRRERESMAFTLILNSIKIYIYIYIYAL